MHTVTFRDSQIRVGKIICLGRNYLAHAKEMKAAAPEEPVLFIKPSSAIIRNGENVIIPSISHELHHEVELVVLIGERGKDVASSRANELIAGYAVGLDMTLRDIQAEAKKNGLPWSVAKGFDTSAPVSMVIEKDKVPNPHILDIALQVNGIVRQHSNTRNMIFRIEDVIAYISSIFTLESGDLIFTGTPEGVGPVGSGDTLEATIESVGTLKVGIE